MKRKPKGEPAPKLLPESQVRAAMNSLPPLLDYVIYNPALPGDEYSRKLFRMTEERANDTNRELEERKAPGRYMLLADCPKEIQETRRGRYYYE